MKRIIALALPLFLSGSCGTDFNKPYSDTPTSGKVRIGCDETLEPLFNAQKDTFMGLYRYAEITPRVNAEREVFQDLLSDSVKAVMVSRKLNAAEEQVFKSRNLIPVTTRVAVDALALIVHPSNPDTLLSMAQLKGILEGTNGTWKSLFPKSSLNDISFVFDHSGSSTVRFLVDSLLEGKTSLPSWCFAARSNQEVIRYVESHPNAMGVIGVNWISDKDDPKQLSFSKAIKVVWLTKANNPIYPDDYFGPYQAYMYSGEYPLTREVYMINREGRNGLGTGFVSFVASEQGQMIARLAGLLPASPYTRDIRIRY